MNKDLDQDFNFDGAILTRPGESVIDNLRRARKDTEQTLVDKITKYAEEGQILTVKIDLKNRQVKANANYPESEDY